ncbi:DNA methyltransferase [Microbispora hainanensis]|uniref:DNA methyltransferase n=1 Tax=Microbispora hainanensis TaxID=568844 RepID=UPI0033C14C5A
MARKNGGWKNKLYYGDNLSVLREHIADETVDLVYLDPPFNSNRSYNVLFKEKSGEESPAQIEAFDDTWAWSHETEMLYIAMVTGSASNGVADALEAMRKLMGDNDMLAYIVMMTARLVELHRVLKPTGSLYLHCDPTASHYLKVILDAIFGPRNFRSEITWLRTSSHNDAKKWSPNADIILYYGKSDRVTWNPVHLPYDEQYIDSKYRYVDSRGRRYRLDNMTSPTPRPNMMYEWKGHASPPNGWRYSRETMRRLDSEGRIWYPDSTSKRPQLKRYLDEQPGVIAGNVWTDIPPINSRAAERLGYPTQKPLALLDRILAASSNPGDVVLDPFAGCGTSVDSAQKNGRRWIGIDITTLAVDLIDARLRHTYGEWITVSYEIRGIPRDMAGARALFARSPFEFERWCVMTVDGQPNDKRSGDKGVDGVIRIPLDGRGGSDRVIVSVKGGAINPSHVRDLIGTVSSQRAAMGVLITLREPTVGMIDAARHSGVYAWPMNGRKYPKVQILTVRELLQGKRPEMPPTLLPYFQAERRYEEVDQSVLF